MLRSSLRRYSTSNVLLEYQMSAAPARRSCCHNESTINYYRYYTVSVVQYSYWWLVVSYEISLRNGNIARKYLTTLNKFLSKSIGFILKLIGESTKIYILCRLQNMHPGFKNPGVPFYTKRANSGDSTKFHHNKVLS